MKNPYTPGYDAIPPVLAGRAEELREVGYLTTNLIENSPHSSDIVLYGPRGNGKTALLNNVALHLRAEKKINVIKRSAYLLKDPVTLQSILSGRPIPRSETVRTKGSECLGLGSTRVGRERDTSTVFKSLAADIVEVTSDIFKKRPTLLMIDEAHRIAPDVLGLINEIAMNAKTDAIPFNFVLAGRPGLPAHLRTLDATFLNRAQQIRLDRLDPQSTEQALFEPLVDRGFKIQLSDDERTKVIDRTQGYPHFIQCVGFAVWEAASDFETKSVDVRVLAGAGASFEKRIEAMYGDRLDEMASANLFDHAVVVANLFRTGVDSIHQEQLEDELSAADDAEIGSEVLQKLIDLDFVWKSQGNSRMYEPGIPSLMDHVLADDHARKSGLHPSNT